MERNNRELAREATVVKGERGIKRQEKNWMVAFKGGEGKLEHFRDRIWSKGTESNAPPPPPTILNLTMSRFGQCRV